MRAEMYELHAAHEDHHWWYVARRSIVLDLIRTHLSNRPERARLLDVGCGAGGMLSAMRQFGDVVGVDPSPVAVALTAERSGADVREGSLPDALPIAMSERFDVITALDVIEHIDDDAAALRTLARLVAPDGLLIVTVPAFAFLWSGHDVVNEHRRRYSSRMLRTVLEGAGLQVERISYFNTLLFPPIAAIRIVRRLLGRQEASADVGAVPAPVNRILSSLFGAERHILRHATLPFGVSLIATARHQQGAMR